MQLRNKLESRVDFEKARERWRAGRYGFDLAKLSNKVQKEQRFKDRGVG